MKAREYLSEIKDLKARKTYLLKSMDEIHIDCSLNAVQYDNTRVQTSYKNGLEERAIKAFERYEHLAVDVADTTEEINKRLDALRAMKNFKYAELLFLHYYKGLSCSEIAEERGLSSDYVSKLNSLALKEFGSIHKEMLKEL